MILKSSASDEADDLLKVLGLVAKMSIPRALRVLNYAIAVVTEEEKIEAEQSKKKDWAGAPKQS